MLPFLVPLQQSRHLLGIIHTSLWHFSICTVISIVNTLVKPSHITEKNTCSSISLLIISAYFTPWKECSNPCTKEESELQGDFRSREAVITIYQNCAGKLKIFLEWAVAWSSNSAWQQEPETAEEAKRVERTYGYTGLCGLFADSAYTVKGEIAHHNRPRSACIPTLQSTSTICTIMALSGPCTQVTQ